MSHSHLNFEKCPLEGKYRGLKKLFGPRMFGMTAERHRKVFSFIKCEWQLWLNKSKTFRDPINRHGSHHDDAW